MHHQNQLKFWLEKVYIAPSTIKSGLLYPPPNYHYWKLEFFYACKNTQKNANPVPSEKYTQEYNDRKIKIFLCVRRQK